MAKANQTDLNWEDAVYQVLAHASGSMHYADIAQAISAQKLRRNVGPNPATVVATTLARSVAKSPDSRFLRIGRGEYAAKDRPLPDVVSTSNNQIEVEEQEVGSLQSFGMYWQRNQIVWTGKPRLLGRQQLGATQVNFCEQIGVYLLHDRERIIYVGRATESIYERLKVHTSDRMGGRWDRFSWFGLRAVGEDGCLLSPTTAWTHNIVIETMEALLIESLEPPLNRKRGDNFSGVEYLQIVDPEIERAKRKQLLAEMAKAAELDDA